MEPAAQEPEHVLLVDCPDRPGLVHQITGVLFRSGANVISNNEFVDSETQRFFMRTAFRGPLEAAAMHAELKALLPGASDVRIRTLAPRRIVVMASREHHCLADLLIRGAYREIGAEILAVISNHDNLRPLPEKFGVPFHHVPHEGLSREDHEAALLRVVEPLRPDYIVLAKYMRVLSAGFVGRWPHRIVNIHHSFLPAFTGAKPYHQAFRRGVKVIGATAHFVSEKLDEGPIIMQQVIPMDHSYSPHDLARAGRDVERTVLSNALRLVNEDRVFLCEGRTIIFD
ncbi:MAG TPA: formyltetrahydrofolate deformylase [Opitutaceae bacterium]|jgi:formyltetrahydrofolate deformylase